MRNKHILFSTVSCMIIFSFEAGAQCVSTQDCSILGYKSSSCSSGKGLKCPFGNAWYCPNTCDISGFQYTCTRTNESPSAAKCGDKYSLCNCAMGLSWKEDGCKTTCQIGWIYYADGTCVTPAAHTTSKVALGVVVYVNADGIGGQVMAAKSLGTMQWGGYESDIPSLPNYTSQASAATDFNSCTNTDKIVAYGGSSKYPAAHAARSYAPTTETKGKWCLPAAGIMTSIYNNLSAVQAGIYKLGGTAFASYTWSSSEYHSNNSWNSYLNNSYGLSTSSNKYGKYDVRPVLEF